MPEYDEGHRDKDDGSQKNHALMHNTVAGHDFENDDKRVEVNTAISDSIPDRERRREKRKHKKKHKSSSKRRRRDRKASDSSDQDCPETRSKSGKRLKKR